MKKSYASLLCAVVAMATVSCQKDASEIDAVATPQRVWTAYTDVDATRTSLDGQRVLWSDTDTITMLDLDGNKYNSIRTTISDAGAKAEFAVPTDEDLWCAVYPADATAVLDVDNVSVATSMPTVQTATVGSFGQGANLAVADASNGPSTPIQFKNVGGVLKFTLDSDVASEITSVRLTVTPVLEGEHLSGACTINVNDDENFATIKSTDGEDYVELQGTFENDSYYFCVLPGTYKDLKLTFYRDGATATYQSGADKQLVVARNSNINIGTFAIPAEKWQAKRYFRKVTQALDDYSGTYLIVYESEQKALSGTTDDGQELVSVAIDADQTIEATETVLANAYTLTKSGEGYTLQNPSGAYAYMKNSTSSFGITTDEKTVSIDFDGTRPIVKYGNYALQEKGSGNSSYIKFYTSTQKPVELYVLDGTLAFNDPDKVHLTVEDTNGKANWTNINVDITCDHDWTATATSDYLKEGVLNVSGTAETSRFTVVFAEQNTSVTEAKTVEVTITAGEGEYQVVKTIKVTQNTVAASISVDPASQSVAADVTSATFTVKANFDWQVLSITADGEEVSEGYSTEVATSDTDDAAKVVTVTFPTNPAVEGVSSSKRSIVVKVGAENLGTASATIEQEGEGGSTKTLQEVYKFTASGLGSGYGTQTGKSANNGMKWTVTFGQDKYVGTNSKQKANCKLGDTYEKVGTPMGYDASTTQVVAVISEGVMANISQVATSGDTDSSTNSPEKISLVYSTNGDEYILIETQDYKQAGNTWTFDEIGSAYYAVVLYYGGSGYMRTTGLTITYSAYK